MTRIWDNLGDNLANAIGSFGAYVVDRHDNGITAYGETNDGGPLRVTAFGANGKCLVHLQSLNPASDQRLEVPLADLEQEGIGSRGVTDKILNMVDSVGTLVDVDSFEGEGETWHESIDEFTEKIDAALSASAAPQLSSMEALDQDEPQVDEAGHDGPQLG
jgi:hypothetical protein